MYLLISFCNKQKDNGYPSLAIIETSTREFKWLYIPEISATNSRGLTQDKENIYVGFQSETVGIAIIRKENLELKQVVYLNKLHDIHSICFHSNNIYLVSTGTDTVYKLEFDQNLDLTDKPKIFWTPEGSIGKSDTHHINSLCSYGDELYVSAFGTKKGELWQTAENGYIFNITKNKRVLENIYHPHSLQIKNGNYYYCESSSRTVFKNETKIGRLNTGYTRGLCISDNKMYIGSSTGRKRSKSTNLINNFKDNGLIEPCCEVNQIRVKNTEQIVNFLEWQDEIYDIMEVHNFGKKAFEEIDHKNFEKLFQTIRNTDLQLNDVAERYHKLGKDHDKLFKEKEIVEKELSQYAEKYHQLGSDFDLLHKKSLENEKGILESNNLIIKLEEEIIKLNKEKNHYQKNHLEAMRQRNNFECQLRYIYRSPKWKIAGLIVLPLKPFKLLVSKINPYYKEFYHSIKDINEYRKTFDLDFAKRKLLQLNGLYTKRLVRKYKQEKQNRIGVLFLSDEQSNCYRYRVLNQMEQLDSGKVFAKDVSVNFPRLDSLIDVFDVFIFVRPHDTKRNLQLTKLIKKKGKVVIFENDDLIFSPNAVKDSGLLKTLPNKLKEIYEKGIGTKFIGLANYGLTTTKTIQQEMEKLKLKTSINRNALNSEIVEISKKFVKDSQDDNYVNIGYFSGSRTHNNDFLIVKDVLLRILEKYKNVNLIIAGYIDLGKEFDEFQKQIVNLPYVNWRKLPQNIMRSDINIIPLEKNKFNNCKSELKYFEAGILKIPTIASSTDPYRFAIKDGVNGFLADTENEWFEKLEKLIKDKKLRKKIGEEAYNHTLKNYTAKSRKDYFTKFIIEIAKRDEKK